jgi:hypothetical protein
MSKHAIRIPPVRAGRTVRWTFEVSADVGADNGTRAQKTSKKPQRRRATVKEDATTPDANSPVKSESVQSAVATPAAEAAVAAEAASPVEPVVSVATPRAPERAVAPARPMTHPGMIAVAAIAVLIVAALAVPRPPTAPGADDGTAALSPDLRQPSAAAVAPTPRTATTRVVSTVASVTVAPRVNRPAKMMPTPKPGTRRIADPMPSEAHVATAAPIVDDVVNDDAAAKLSGPETSASAAPASSLAATSAPVTITGCLEISVDHDEFRLTDTDGADAPRARSWRTGFLKKRSAPVSLIEPPDRLALQTQVGRRVAVTGVLTSRDLKLSALRVVGASCN